ncbi:MAG: glycoside hydrolase, partial [Candidatus Sumerlaeota bacterium]|nr:glycoside hydrolase [Candidatus Sumerlaeota bacterium]
DGMIAMKKAFPHTVVIQYTNFPREALEDLTRFQSENGVGLGGPDIRPYDLTGVGNPQTGIFRLYPRVEGVAPLGAAVQSSDYVMKRKGGPFDPTPVNEIYEFSRDTLHLNYIFWLNKKGYFEKVVEMMNDPSFPKDPAGGLNAELPKCMQ